MSTSEIPKRNFMCESCRSTFPAGLRGPLPTRCRRCKRKAENRLERRRATVRDPEAYTRARRRIERRELAARRAMGQAQRELNRAKAAHHRLLGDKLEHDERARALAGCPWPDDLSGTWRHREPEDRLYPEGWPGAEE